MSGKRPQNSNRIEYPEIWRSQRSTEMSCTLLGNISPKVRPDEPIKSKPDHDKLPAVKDKERYPPIVTIDGRVDTDIDHLIDDLADDYHGPVDEVPSKYPKPHVFSVIEGSLDDDVDSFANDDGTMEHTLVDAPKSLSPSDLQDVATIDSSRKSPGHSKTGLNEQSHTDRSHNKMYVDSADSEAGCDRPREHVSGFVSKNRSADELKRCQSDNERRSGNWEQMKKERDAGRANIVQDTRKRDNKEGQGKQLAHRSSYSDHRKQNSSGGQYSTKATKSDPVNADVYKRHVEDIDGEYGYPLNSRAVMVLKCDSGEYTSNLMDCPSVKECIPKDTDSAVYMHAYTESLTCMFTDESLREGHVSLDVSAARVDQDDSESSQTDSESDGHIICERIQDKTSQIFDRLGTNQKLQLEHTRFHLPSCSDNSLSKSSELCPRSRCLTQANKHFFSSHVLDSSQHERFSSEPVNISDSIKSSCSVLTSSQNICNSLVDADGRLNVSECSKNVELNKSLVRVKHSPENSSERLSINHSRGAESAIFDGINVRLSSLCDNIKSVGSESLEVPARQSETVVQAESVEHTAASDNSWAHKKELSKSPVELDDQVDCPHAREEFQQKKHSTCSSVKEINDTTKTIDGDSSIRRTPCQHISEGKKENNLPDMKIARSGQADVQVNTDLIESRTISAQSKSSHNKERQLNSAGTEAPLHSQRMKASLIKAGHFPEKGSDTESLDSEARYVLQQLRIAQVTNRKTNELLKHVQTIMMGQPEYQSGLLDATSHLPRRYAAVDSRRSSDTTGSEVIRQSKKDEKIKQSKLTLDRLHKTSGSALTGIRNHHQKNRDTCYIISPGNQGRVSNSDVMDAGDRWPVDTGDRGRVHTLVSTFDKHHRVVTEDKVDSKAQPATCPQTIQMYTDKWTANQVRHDKEYSGVMHSPGDGQHRVAPRYESRHFMDSQVRRCHERSEHWIIKGDQSQDKKSAERHVRPYINQKMVSPFNKHAISDEVSEVGLKVGPSARARNFDDSTSSSPDSSDYEELSPEKQVVGVKHLREDFLDKRAASVPRKVRHSLAHKRRTSPDVFSCTRDTLKSKRRNDANVKRSRTRGSSMKDSLRAAFKIAEESMSAAAKVAEALNIVMRASEMSPISSSSVEDRYTSRLTREHMKPQLPRSKCPLNAADARTEPKVTNRWTSDQVRSPEKSPKREYNQRGVNCKLQVKDTNRIAEQTDKKSNTSHINSISQDRTSSHKTSVFSPSRKDTFSRNPKNVRTAYQQLQAQIPVLNSKEMVSQSSPTLTEHSRKCWGDTANLKTESVTQACTNDSQVIVEVAYTNSPECLPTHGDNTESALQVQKVTFQENSGCPKQNNTCSFGSDAGTDKSILRLRESPKTIEEVVKKYQSNETMNECLCYPLMSQCEQSSKVILSREEWAIPPSCCSSTRKMDSYFTQIPPIIDQNLHSISLSTKQIIRRQKIGSCVDPGLADSGGSDSLEFNSNFNRSTTGRQLRLSLAHTIEKENVNRLDLYKCEEEMAVSQSWQHDARLQYESEVLPCQPNVFRHQDRGKDCSLLSSSTNQNKETAYHCLSRSHEESCSSRKETVQSRDQRRTSYQVHEEQMLQTGDYIKCSSVMQESPQCVASLCYTDLSSPASSCFDMHSEIKMCPENHSEHNKSARTDHELDKNPLSTYREYSRKNVEQNRESAQDSTVSEASEKLLDQSQYSPARQQLVQLPKPRMRRLRVSDGEGLPLSGLTSKTRKFSPIFEETWSEEEIYVQSGDYQPCPGYLQQSQNINNNVYGTDSNTDYSSYDDAVCGLYHIQKDKGAVGEVLDLKLEDYGQKYVSYSGKRGQNHRLATSRTENRVQQARSRSESRTESMLNAHRLSRGLS